MNDVVVSASLSRFPREACGFILSTGLVVVAENVSTDPVGFQVDAASTERWWPTGLVVAVWHSHPFDPAIPSDVDQELAHPELECWIYSIPDEQLGKYRPDPSGMLLLLSMEDLSEF